MHDRARAIALLQQARDILMERLTERLLESRDSILEDALGLSYSSEIDAVQDQIGQRLNHVNLLLSNLPPIEEQPATEEDEAAPPIAQPVLAYEPSAMESSQFPSDAVPLIEVSPPALSASPTVIYVGSSTESQSEPTFAAFVQCVLGNDLEAAGRMLAPLFGVTAERGRQCAQRFHEQLREQPHFLHKAMTLRNELVCGSVNGALLLLWECFGLQGVESLAALQTLKARATAS